MAKEVTYFTDMTEETEETTDRRKSKCYTANIQIAGIITKALIDTGAEITCISEEFFNGNRESFNRYPCLPLAGVAVAEPLGGKAVRLTRQIYADVQLTNTIVQLAKILISTWRA